MDREIKANRKCAGDSISYCMIVTAQAPGCEALPIEVNTYSCVQALDVQLREPFLQCCAVEKVTTLLRLCRPRSITVCLFWSSWHRWAQHSQVKRNDSPSKRLHLQKLQRPVLRCLGTGSPSRGSSPSKKKKGHVSEDYAHFNKDMTHTEAPDVIYEVHDNIANQISVCCPHLMPSFNFRKGPACLLLDGMQSYSTR
eukprot:308946-Pelagomonas_calceolata.AAC.4